MAPIYEIRAIRYAHLERTASHSFIGGDQHDGPMPLDYHPWSITSLAIAAEALAMGVKAGVDPVAMLDVLNASSQALAILD
jgi:hypothetical protein